MLALDIRQTVDDVYRAESRRIFATLVRLVNDFDLAEEAMHEAFASAIERWPRDGIPSNPRTWLVSAGRFKAIDAIRRRSLFDASLAEIGNRLERNAASKTPRDEDEPGRPASRQAQSRPARVYEVVHRSEEHTSELQSR